MKRIILAILALSVAGNGYGQALKSGFENLRQGKYAEAAKVFDKALSKGTEVVAANYGMGCVLTSPQYPGFNNVKGFRMIRNANDRFRLATPKNKQVCTDVYGFGQSDIHAKMLEVAKRDLDSVKRSNTINDYEWYILTFEGAEPQVEEARNMLSLLVWQSTSKTGTFRAYKDFADKYPNSQYAAEAREKYEQLWRQLCRNAYDEGELTSMLQFAEQYPKYPFYTEREKKELALAKEGENLKLYIRYKQDYEPYYNEYIEKAAPSELAYVAMLRTISPYVEMGRFAEAANRLLQYKDKFPARAADIQKTADMLLKPGNKSKTTPLPPAINTEHLEYAPVITPDGNTLYFCGNNREDNIGNEDIFVAHMVDGKWQKATIFDQFNTEMGNEAPLAVSPDGNMLLIYKDSNIYYTERRASGWTPLKKFPGLNTGKSWEADAAFSPDGNAVFFISDRKGNVGNHHPHEKLFHGSYHGNSDIYVSTRNADGSWNMPQNIGPVVNTPYTERSPWLASDMKTLYFSSDGHYGMGMMDVYKCTRLSDTSWTQWSQPVNLGKEINTVADDYNYLISTDGQSALFTSMKGGNLDLSTVQLPEAMRPEIIGIVFGKVTDSNGKFLPARIKWEDLQTAKMLGNLMCDPTDGSYFITLPAGHNYGYYVEMDGYYPVSGNLNTENLKSGKNIERNIVMNSIDDILGGKVSIVLENIFFDSNKYDLKPESYPELNRLAAFIKDNAGAVLEIQGHTDNSGSAEANKILSQQRADSVRRYLVSQGCPEDQIRTMGYGPSKPIDSNATEAGKARNRRVEFKIMK
ncbi:MAG: OmpA family protein [Bacteroidales bacterium]|nr:OmpA family protein [Bacteroidales bacterium]